MTDNILDQLSGTQAPPVPDGFDRRVHDRLNSRLLVSHLADLAFRGLPWACIHMLVGMLGAGWWSISNHHPGESAQDKDDLE